MERIGYSAKLGVSLLAAVVTLGSLGCATGEGADEGVPPSHDSALLGTWTDATGGASQKYTHTMDFSEGGVYYWGEQYWDNPAYYGTTLTYRQGTWRTTEDALVLSYTEYGYTSFGYTTLGTVTDTLSRYRLRDNGDLGLSAMSSNSWTYYHREGESVPPPPPDTTTFCVVAMPDTFVFPPNDTAVLIARAYSPDTLIAYYLWSVDGGLTYDTSYTPRFSYYVCVGDTGTHTGAVRAVDANGAVTRPDYFDFTVDPYRPTAEVHDTSFHLSDSRLIHAEASDRNGRVVRYFWRSADNRWRDTTDTNIVRWSDTALGTTTCLLRVMDSDSVYSYYDTFHVTLMPCLIGTPGRDGCIDLFRQGDGSFTVFLNSVITADGSTRVNWLRVDSTGRALAGPTPLFSVSGSFLGTRVVSDGRGGYLVCGDAASGGASSMLAGGVTQNGTLVWQSMVDSSVRAADIAPLPSGGFVVVGSCYGASSDTQLAYVQYLNGIGTPLTRQVFAFGAYSVATHVAAQTDGILVYLSPPDSLLKFDLSGSRLWERFVGRGILELLDLGANSYAVCREGLTSVDYGWRQAVIEKYVDTTRVWQNAAGASGQHFVPYVFTSCGDSLVVACRTEGGGLLQTIDAAGLSLATCHFSDPEPAIGVYTFAPGLRALAAAGDGTFILAVNTSRYGAQEQDVMLAKIGANGQKLW